MFAIPSIQKILVLVSILAAVWYGFKFLTRLKEQRDQQAGKTGARPARKNPWSMPGRKASRPPEPEASPEEMVECPVCRTYVAARATRSCGKPGCPY